jgi:hypothetical protein
MASSRTALVLIEDGRATADHRALGDRALQQTAPVTDGVPADDVLEEDHLAGGGPDVPDGPPAAIAGQDPQDQIGIRQIRQQLPVAHQQLQPIDARLAESRLGPQPVAEGARHKHEPTG